jgi:hypothetical protein
VKYAGDKASVGAEDRMLYWGTLGFDEDGSPVKMLIAMIDGCAVTRARPRVTPVMTYLPGPHTGSDSGR